MQSTRTDVVSDVCERFLAFDLGWGVASIERAFSASGTSVR